MSVKSLAVSQTGKVREHNEDAVFVDDKSGLWLVADGMGGHACGEVASALAAETVSRSMADGVGLSEAIELAHRSILEQSKLHPEQQGMGTTIVAAQLLRAGFKIVWVGDSRAYLFNGKPKTRKLGQISADHTFVQDMVYREVLTAEEAINHPQGNLINRSLGMTEGRFKVDSIKVKPETPGYLLLCSDGVSDYISDQQLQSSFEQAQSLEVISDAISDAVLKTEAADNFSFVLIEFHVDGLAKFRNKIFHRLNK